MTNFFILINTICRVLNRYVAKRLSISADKYCRLLTGFAGWYLITDEGIRFGPNVKQGSNFGPRFSIKIRYIDFLESLFKDNVKIEPPIFFYCTVLEWRTMCACVSMLHCYCDGLILTRVYVAHVGIDPPAVGLCTVYLLTRSFQIL